MMTPADRVYVLALTAWAPLRRLLIARDWDAIDTFLESRAFLIACGLATLAIDLDCEVHVD